MENDDDVRFLSLLFAPYDSGLIEVRGLKEGRVVREWFPVNQPGLAAKCAHLYDQDGYSAYFGVLPRSERSGKKAAVTQAAWLWAEVDFKDTSAAKASLALETSPPHILVHSGHGWHIYWQMDQTVDVSDPGVRRGFEQALRAKQATVLSDPAVHNADRMLRVPGTLNRKTLPIVKVRVLEWPTPPEPQASEWLPDARNPLFSRRQRLFHRLQHRNAIGVGSDCMFALYRERYVYRHG